MTTNAGMERSSRVRHARKQFKQSVANTPTREFAVELVAAVIMHTPPYAATMTLTETLILIPGIGPYRARRLWQAWPFSPYVTLSQLTINRKMWITNYMREHWT